MQWLSGLRMRIHVFLLKRQLSRNASAHESVSLKQAKYIGILFDASKEENIRIIKEYSRQLENLDKRIELLAYHKDPKKTEGLPFPLFTSKEVNWYLKPTGEQVNKFMNHRFDLLINANVEPCAPLEYISSLSRARYRIGYYDPRKTNHYDLMISLNKEHSLNHYIDRVNYYLEILKTT